MWGEFISFLLKSFLWLCILSNRLIRTKKNLRSHLVSTMLFCLQELLFPHVSLLQSACVLYNSNSLGADTHYWGAVSINAKLLLYLDICLPSIDLTKKKKKGLYCKGRSLQKWPEIFSFHVLGLGICTAEICGCQNYVFSSTFPF